MMKNKKAWLALAVGLIAFIFSNGRWNFFLGAWIWPFAFLYYERRTENVKQFLPLVLAIIIGNDIRWIGLLNVGYAVDIAFCSVWAIVWILPFILDRLLIKRYNGILYTLLFPALYTTVEFIRSFSLVGSFGITAYTQSGFLPVMQAVSIIGSFGLSFFIVWFGSVLEYATANNFNWKKISKAVITYATIFVLLIGYGCIRLVAFPSSNNAEETIKVASIIVPYSAGFADERVRLDTVAVIKDQTKRAMEDNPDVLCWCEEAFVLDDTDEESFTELAVSLAKKYKVSMIVPCEIKDTDNSEDGYNFNKVKMISPDGEVKDYVKTKLVPVTESSSAVAGDGSIPTMKVGNATMSSIICFDTDYPSYVNGYASNASDDYADTNILFVPTWDWYSVSKPHYEGAIFRAVENGISYVRVAYDGVSGCIDYQGHELSRFSTADAGFDTIQYTTVPLNNVSTIYSQFGKFIDYAFALFGIIMIIIGFIPKKSK